MKKRTTPQRIPNEILKDMDSALDLRLNNKLISRKDAKLPEGFRLIRRMPEWSMALNKLGTLPKKEDLMNVAKKKR